MKKQMLLPREKGTNESKSESVWGDVDKKLIEKVNEMFSNKIYFLPKQKYFTELVNVPKQQQKNLAYFLRSDS